MTTIEYAARQAAAAARELAWLTEWEPAGLMLRVQQVAECSLDAADLRVARHFAVDARDAALNRAGRDTAQRLLDIIDRAISEAQS